MDYPIVSDPELAERVRSAAERFGWRGVQVDVIDRRLPLLRSRRKRLSVPASLKSLLTGDELEAFIGCGVAHRPDALLRGALATYLPWLIALLVSIIADRMTGLPWEALAAAALLAWHPYVTRRGLSSGYAARIAVPRYVQRGGDPHVLLRAMYKVYAEMVRLGYKQPGVLGAMRTTLKAVAGAAGLTLEQATARGQELGVPDVLLQLL